MRPIQWLAGLALALSLGIAHAQGDGKTDTGGGMGGTGNSSDKGLLAEIGADSRMPCQEIAIATRQTNDGEISEPVCTGQTLKNPKNNTLVLSFRTDTKLTIRGIATIKVYADTINQQHYELTVWSEDLGPLTINTATESAVIKPDSIAQVVITGSTLFISERKTSEK